MRASPFKPITVAVGSMRAPALPPTFVASVPAAGLACPAGKDTASPELQEAALEGLLDLCRCPGFMHAIFLSCDCRVERRWVVWVQGCVRHCHDLFNGQQGSLWHKLVSGEDVRQDVAYEQPHLCVPCMTSSGAAFLCLSGMRQTCGPPGSTTRLALVVVGVVSVEKEYGPV